MKFSKVQLITMGALVGLGLFNPFSVAILEKYFEWAYTGIAVASTAWLVGFILYKTMKPERTNIPVVRSKRPQAKD